MKLFDRLDNNIDYNNHYTIRKAVGIIENEFNLAIQRKDISYARELLETTKKIYEKLSSTYRESSAIGGTMSYMQKVWAKRLRKFIAYLTNSINKKFNTSTVMDIINETQQ